MPLPGPRIGKDGWFLNGWGQTLLEGNHIIERQQLTFHLDGSFVYTVTNCRQERIRMGSLSKSM